MPPDNALLIRAAAREGGELAVEDGRALFAAMLAGEVAPHELARIFTAWRGRRASLAELSGFMRALDAHTGRLERLPEGPRPILLPAYHGTLRQPNLTALVALLLQRYEIPVLVHGVGNASAAEAGADRSARAAMDGPSERLVTTAAVLWELGIEPVATLADADARLRRGSVAYVPSELLVPGLARFGASAPRESLPTVLQSVAQLIDPFAGDGYRVIGAAAADLVLMREFLLASRTDALLFAGAEGEPFADPRRQARLEHVAAGAVTPCADAEGDGNIPAPSLPPASDAATTAAWIADVLAGTEPVPTSIVMQLGCCLAGARRLGAAA